ncbi:MAG: hypothetical protein JNM56_12355, partial [Planctomycetia bacterium]|nr:hypothetical protein [Planctomycetia bacterium]
MANAPLSHLVQHLCHQAGVRAVDDVSDGELLESFILRRDEAAFGSLVRRYGPLVLGLCRRILRDGHDAEDAFQATFVILVRKASA